MGTPAGPHPASGSPERGGGRLADEHFAEALPVLRTPLLRLARLLMSDASDAEDLVQDVMAELWSHRSRFDPERGSLAAWAAAVLRNRAVDRVRAVRAASAREERYAAASSSPPYDQVLEIVEQRLEHAMVRDHLPDLPPALAQALALVYFHGLTSREAAAAAGVSPSTFGARLRAARRRLGEALAASDEPPLITWDRRRR